MTEQLDKSALSKIQSTCISNEIAINYLVDRGELHRETLKLFLRLQHNHTVHLYQICAFLSLKSGDSELLQITEKAQKSYSHDYTKIVNHLGFELDESQIDELPSNT